MGVEEGEERQLRAQLRQMESRRAAVERCGLVRTALGSEGGVADGIATVQGHVQGVLMQEEAAAALSQGEDTTAQNQAWHPHRWQTNVQAVGCGQTRVSCLYTAGGLWSSFIWCESSKCCTRAHPDSSAVR